MLDNPLKNRFAVYNAVARPEGSTIQSVLQDIYYPESLLEEDVPTFEEIPEVIVEAFPEPQVEEKKRRKFKKKKEKSSTESDSGNYDHTISFKQLCDNIGAKIRVTSELRTTGKPTSHHRHRDQWGYSAAIDVVPLDGDYEGLKNKLLSSPEARNWFAKRGYGILNEIIPQVKNRTNATGNHFHIGPDKWAQRVWTQWLNNPQMKATQYIA